MKLGIIIGGAAGYYFGAKAGRERYSEINRKLKDLRGKVSGDTSSASSEASSAAMRAQSATGTTPSTTTTTTHITGTVSPTSTTSTTLGAAGTETSPASFGTLP